MLIIIAATTTTFLHSLSACSAQYKIFYFFILSQHEVRSIHPLSNYGTRKEVLWCIQNSVWPTATTTTTGKKRWTVEESYCICKYLCNCNSTTIDFCQML